MSDSRAREVQELSDQVAAVSLSTARPPAAVLAQYYGPPAKFPQYNRLPEELQTVVWQAAVVPRLVLWQRHRIPGILHACKLSRMVALGFYTWIDQIDPLLGYYGFFFNFELDIIDRNEFLPLLAYERWILSLADDLSRKPVPYLRDLDYPLGLECVKTLALNIDETTRLFEEYPGFLFVQIPLCFPCLEHLIIMINPEIRWWTTPEHFAPAKAEHATSTEQRQAILWIIRDYIDKKIWNTHRYNITLERFEYPAERLEKKENLNGRVERKLFALSCLRKASVDLEIVSVSTHVVG